MKASTLQELSDAELLEVFGAILAKPSQSLIPDPIDLEDLEAINVEILRRDYRAEREACS